MGNQCSELGWSPAGDRRRERWPAAAVAVGGDGGDRTGVREEGNERNKREKGAPTSPMYRLDSPMSLGAPMYRC